MNVRNLFKIANMKTIRDDNFKISLAKFWAVNCTIRKIIIMYFITTICQYVEVTVFWLFIQSTIQKKDLGVVLLIREKDQVNSYCTIGKIWGLPLVVLSQCSSFIPGTQVRLRTRAKTYFFFFELHEPTSEIPRSL